MSANKYLDPATIVELPNGEQINLTEFMARKLEDYADEHVTDASSKDVRDMIKRGVPYEVMRHFLKLDDDMTQAMAAMNIDLDVVFRRVHQRLVKRFSH